LNIFTFQPRWKEELLCTSAEGSFVLEMPMGILSVYLPTELMWQSKGPKWAINLWPRLKEELEIWCRENKANFYVDETAGVY